MNNDKVIYYNPRGDGENRYTGFGAAAQFSHERNGRKYYRCVAFRNCGFGKGNTQFLGIYRGNSAKHALDRAVNDI